MIKGIKGLCKDFMKYVRKSSLYKSCLKAEIAEDIIKETYDLLSDIGVGKDLKKDVKSLVKIFTKGSAPAQMLAAAGLIYFVAPLDIIPDFIPIVGYADDVVVVGVILDQIIDAFK